MSGAEEFCGIFYYYTWLLGARNRDKGSSAGLTSAFSIARNLESASWLS